VVCGLADHHRGERVKAYVKVREGSELSAAELRAFLKDKLAPFEMPSEIEFLAEFPPELLQRLPRKRFLIRKFGKKRLATSWDAVRPLCDLFRGWRLASRPSAAEQS
jgi:long-chain acyl-CoA synthetase